MNKKHITLKLASLVLMLSAPSVFGCDMHGNLGFGIYGKQGQSNTSFSKAMKYDVAKVQLRHPYFTKSKLGESKTIEIKYTVPSQVTDAQISISSSDDIKVESGNVLALNEPTGTYPVTFKANATGRHNLVLKVEGSAGEKPISMVRHIGLMISD